MSQGETEDPRARQAQCVNRGVNATTTYPVLHWKAYQPMSQASQLVGVQGTR